MKKDRNKSSTLRKSKMTILIINNYYKNENLSKVYQIVNALRNVGKSKHEIWSFSEINRKRILDEIKAIILSGSTAHLQDSSHLSMYKSEIRLLRRVKVPILGICFGHQLIGKAFGSQIHALPRFIHGFKSVKILEPNEIFSSWRKETEIILSQSHQDCITNLPDDFILLAQSESCKIEAITHEKKSIYGVQAHIERASHEKPDGWQILKNFISNAIAK